LKLQETLLYRYRIAAARTVERRFFYDLLGTACVMSPDTIIATI